MKLYLHTLILPSVLNVQIVPFEGLKGKFFIENNRPNHSKFLRISNEPAFTGVNNYICSKKHSFVELFAISR